MRGAVTCVGRKVRLVECALPLPRWLSTSIMTMNRVGFALCAVLGVVLFSATALPTFVDAPSSMQGPQFKQSLKVRRFAVGQVQRVTITQAAAVNADGEICPGLALDAGRVEYFVKHAKAVSERDYFKEHHVFNDCSAVARVKFKNGRAAEYRLDAGGTAILTPVVNGKATKTLYYYYCENCAGFLAPDFKP